MTSSFYAPALAKLIDKFNSLPGIGPKSAQRLAFHVLSMSDEAADDFADTIRNAHKKIHKCKKCCNLTDSELCPICSNDKRDKSIVCVVQDPKDVIALEKTQEYTALYHVLGGVISPMNGVGPDELSIKELIARVNEDNVSEVIMATSANAEGETTAIYISRLLKPLGVKVTRLAYGIPVGADLEYADEVTLVRALEGRREL
ncbi:MAG: recombination protein RecR [Clostridia bacterium]|nr:recombination protein RecR [Clostridia bacterium]MBQ2152833.1 recombination protein RecR [Clostridia bacterium]